MDIFDFRDQIIKNRPERVLRTLKALPNFNSAFYRFVQEEAHRESEGILLDKDPARKDFTLDSLRKFTYREQLNKLQTASPLLVACVTGAIAKTKVKTSEDLTRKGFGGPNRDQKIDLTPAIVQTVSRIMKNKHPYSLTLMASLNSLFLWTCRVSGHVFQLFNSLGDCYR